MDADVPHDAPPAYEDLVPAPSRRRHRDRTHQHRRVSGRDHLPPSPPASPPQGLGLGIQVPAGHVEYGHRVSRLSCDPPPYSAEDVLSVPGTLSSMAANSRASAMSHSSMSLPSAPQGYHVENARFPPVPPHSRQPPDNIASRTATAPIPTRSHAGVSRGPDPRHYQDFSSFSSSWSSWSPTLGLRSPPNSPASRSGRNFPSDYLPTGPHAPTPPHSVSSSPATGPASILSSGRPRAHGHRSPRVRFVDDALPSSESSSPLPESHAAEGGEDEEIFAFDPVVNTPFSHYVPTSDFSSTIGGSSCTCGKENCRPPGRLATRPACSCGGASCPGGVIAKSRSPPASTTMTNCPEQPRSSSSPRRRTLSNGTARMTRTITAPVWASSLDLPAIPRSH